MKSPSVIRYLSRDDIINNKICIEERLLDGATTYHWHDYFEIELVTGGSALHRLNSDDYVNRRGSLYLLTPADFHVISCHGEPMEHFNIAFTGSFVSDDLLKAIFSHQGNIFHQYDDPALSDLIALFRLLMSGSAHPDGMFAEYMKNILETIIITLLRDCNVILDPKVEKGFFEIKKAIAYLYMEFRENPGLEDAAKIAGYNKDYFCRVFHAYTGQSYLQYLTEIKLKYACSQLTAGSRSIDGICFDSGFNSLPSFWRAFRRKFGCSPSAWRKKHQVQSGL